MKSVQPVNTSALQAGAPHAFKNIQPVLDAAVAQDDHKIVVLDDDPTGIQTLHDISVYTDWEEESIARGFQEQNKTFYILTNSRSFSRAKTAKVHREICRRILKVAHDLHKKFLIISRSDSTLRGHYPLETEILAEELAAGTGTAVDGEILCPYFKEGGRFTLNNIHYVQYGDALIPAGQTEFAKDKTFGYASSDLRDYIEEKTGGTYTREAVTTISLDELRQADIRPVVDKLMKVTGFGKVVVNAVCQDDIRVFAIALYQALARGKYFLFRSAAALVKEMSAIHDKPLLTHDELIAADVETTKGGIVVVGSHTEKTTKQIEALKDVPHLRFIAFNSDLVREDGAFRVEINRVLQEEETLLRQGCSVVVYTSRKELIVPSDTQETALERSVRISEAVQSLVGRLQVKPAFVIAKGGITSSDVGTKALHVRRADVMGQICAGVPVWKTGSESKFPRIPYVIFPGNVGEADTLKQAIQVLQQA